MKTNIGNISEKEYKAICDYAEQIGLEAEDLHDYEALDVVYELRGN